MTLILTPDQEAVIRQHAVNEYPGECCGVLLGDSSGNAAYVSQVIPLANKHEDGPQRRFRVEPYDLLQVEKLARISKKNVIGFYHSHPDVPAVPSQYDIDHAWEEYSYVIVQMDKGSCVVLRSWKLDLDASRFNEENVQVNSCILEAAAAKYVAVKSVQ